MKKAIAFLITLSILVICFSSLAETYDMDYEISDGVKLGMTIPEILDAHKDKSLPEKPGFEATALGEPFSYVFLDFVDKDTPFQTETISERDRGWVINANFSFSTRNLLPTPLSESAIKANGFLSTVLVVFTSDQYFKTVEDTYNKIEEKLIESFGETRYTSRRGQSLPFVKGYSDCFLPIVNTSDRDTLGFTVPLYSQRIIATADNRYVVINHFVFLTDESFLHGCVFSLIPVDISSLQ